MTQTQRPSVTFQVPPSISPASPTMNLKTRGRSGSIVKVEVVGDRSVEEVMDRNAYQNKNADWVNKKGAWMIHPVLIVVGKFILDAIPGMSQQASWISTNLIYLACSYLMFHWVTGIPFDNDLHGGAYDDLTLWEQIDDGAQYTPAKKWLISVPIVLFLASTHYTNYNPWLFAVNLTALILALLPKLPQFHRQRVRFMPQSSGVSTPLESSFPPSVNGSAPSTPTLKTSDLPAAQLQ